MIGLLAKFSVCWHLDWNVCQNIFVTGPSHKEISFPRKRLVKVIKMSGSFYIMFYPKTGCFVLKKGCFIYPKRDGFSKIGAFFTLKGAI